MKTISSPKVGEAGKVAVIAPALVFTKYPSPAAALNADVLMACHEVPPPAPDTAVST